MAKPSKEQADVQVESHARDHVVILVHGIVTVEVFHNKLHVDKYDNNLDDDDDEGDDAALEDELASELVLNEHHSDSEDNDHDDHSNTKCKI